MFATRISIGRDAHLGLIAPSSEVKTLPNPGVSSLRARGPRRQQRPGPFPDRSPVGAPFMDRGERQLATGNGPVIGPERPRGIADPPFEAEVSAYPPRLGSAAPGGLELPERVVGDLEQAAAIGVHLIEVSILVSLRRGAMRKDDLRAIGRPGRPGVALLARQLHQMRAVRQDRVELRGGAIGEGAEGLEEDVRTIGRPVLIARLQLPQGVSCLRPVPSRLMRNSACWSYDPFAWRLRTKRIYVPSGDQAGELSPIPVGGGGLMNCIAWLPSACMIQSAFPRRQAVGTNRILRPHYRAIWLPSGDHLPHRVPAHTPVQWVSCLRPVPSAFITQTSLGPFADYTARRGFWSHRGTTRESYPAPHCSVAVSWRTLLPSALAEKIAAEVWFGSRKPCQAMRPLGPMAG